jgi:uncharacterized repeat protein (TIGR04076 family)
MVDEATLNFLKEMLGYTEAQWETWKSNPRNLKVVENLTEFPKYKVVFEVTSSVGCAARHKVGDQIVFDGSGCLLSKESPEKICFGLLSPISPIAGMVLDKICLGEDPTQMAFNSIHCVDVGVDHGGWGEVVVAAKVKKIQE